MATIFRQYFQMRFHKWLFQFFMQYYVLDVESTVGVSIGSYDGSVQAIIGLGRFTEDFEKKRRKNIWWPLTVHCFCNLMGIGNRCKNAHTKYTGWLATWLSNMVCVYRCESHWNNSTILVFIKFHVTHCGQNEMDAILYTLSIAFLQLKYQCYWNMYWITNWRLGSALVQIMAWCRPSLVQANSQTT